jgi:hypothetical protein
MPLKVIAESSRPQFDSSLRRIAVCSFMVVFAFFSPAVRNVEVKVCSAHLTEMPHGIGR